MRRSAKIITALSVTGLAVAAGSAFTGAGLSTSGTASSAQFVGGTVGQSVTGATLDSVVYAFEDAASQTKVNKVTLTFAAGTADGKTIALDLTAAVDAAFSCGAVGAETVNASVCTPSVLNATATSVTKADITVS